MNLRSRKSIAFGSNDGSKVSSQGSGPRALPQLAPIHEKTSSKSSYTNSTTASEASLAMDDSMRTGAHSNPPWTNENRVEFNTKLIFAKVNKHGAKLYHDF